jgi:hypothetical protein
MERKVAVMRLSKLIGKGFGYRVNHAALTAEDREAAKTALTGAIEERNRLRDQRDARERALLEADAEYQSLKAQATAARDHADKIQGSLFSHKITVGKSNGMFFLVQAEGDSWEEVIKKITAKKSAT